MERAASESEPRVSDALVCEAIGCWSPGRRVWTRERGALRVCPAHEKALADAGELLPDAPPLIRLVVNAPSTTSRPLPEPEISSMPRTAVLWTPSLRPKPIDPNLCRIDGCPNKANVRGLCFSCYERARKRDLIAELALPAAAGKSHRGSGHKPSRPQSAEPVAPAAVVPPDITPAEGGGLVEAAQVGDAHPDDASMPEAPPVVVEVRGWEILSRWDELMALLGLDPACGFERAGDLDDAKARVRALRARGDRADELEREGREKYSSLVTIASILLEAGQTPGDLGEGVRTLLAERRRYAGQVVELERELARVRRELHGSGLWDESHSTSENAHHLVEAHARLVRARERRVEPMTEEHILRLADQIETARVLRESALNGKVVELRQLIRGEACPGCAGKLAGLVDRVCGACRDHLAESFKPEGSHA